MRRAELVERALATRGRPTKYRLGAGAPYTAPHPADEGGACDCSGFVLWALGVARHQPTLAFLEAELGHRWMNTDAMVVDAGVAAGLFLDTTIYHRPGDLVLYPGRALAERRAWTGAGKGPKIGHVGILVGATRKGWSVVHCSAGNFRRFGDAIHVTDLSVFERVPYFRVIRYVGLED